MRVGFFRHGPAAPPGEGGVSEEERPLTEEGIEKTRRAARGVLALDLGVDLILSSPLRRARQTAEILAEALRGPRPRVSDRLLPDVSGAGLLECLKGLKAEAPVLVGHEPSLSAAVAALIGAPESGAIEMKKAGLAVVETGGPSPRPPGTLVLLLAPSVLRGLAK
jgi:phosphohistidine phosphatase